jgi:hypothetical protein
MPSIPALLAIRLYYDEDADYAGVISKASGDEAGPMPANQRFGLDTDRQTAKTDKDSIENPGVSLASSSNC